MKYVDLIEIMATGDPAKIMVAKSILDEAGIKYLAKGEGLQDLFAMGRIGTGFNPLVGPVKFLVRDEDQEIAKELLKELQEN
ncbi:Putative signal transducing protein [Desulfotomaculum arcticum]|uniref:Putative signal transducing protein n=1 Tax=Desulfotruncus arcticus DSM 17038 TaxID=1121424 RepID=A0A1I2V774_9FIRM|nr:DUF2007 domain-containing protein [Desulfotruncus arcticus]SFG84269.1 Putative signal transducing protein [Desulfotomaculum arcticum] [Desulfotruncus arcticus DSM 17038]